MGWPKGKPRLNHHFTKSRIMTGAAGDPNVRKPVEGGEFIGQCSNCRKKIPFGSGWILKPVNNASHLFCGQCG
jgi:hypothetical protein